MSIEVSSESPSVVGPAISQVSEMLGVPAPTLRSWERRYGVPTTSRSAGGHRRYAEVELHQIRVMRDEIARGKRAADAALAVRLLLDEAHPQRSRIDTILAAAAHTDSSTISRVLDESLDELGLGLAIDNVLLPTLRQIGAWWESSRCEIPQERLLTETCRSWLAQQISFAQVQSPEPPILLACGPRDMHTIGLEALAALLAQQQRSSRILGSKTSELTLVSAAIATSAAAVVVVSQLRTHRRAAVDALRSAEEAGFRVFYAGNAFAFDSERRDVPGVYLGEAISAASAIVLDSVRVDAPRPGVPRQIA